MQLAAQVGVPVPVSAILYEAVQFALGGGGGERRRIRSDGRLRHGDARLQPGVSHRSKRLPPHSNPAARVSYRDVRLDPDRKTITLLRPLILDLGAVAKGLAIDLAARELRPFENFAIDAGGDLYLGGCNPSGEPWSVGIRHPRREIRADRFLCAFQPRRVHLG